MAMKMVGDLMNMGNEERVSKVSSRFNRNPNHAIYLPVKSESERLKEMVKHFINPFEIKSNC